MINLNEYINNDHIDEYDLSLLSHIAIEYKINDIAEGKKTINEKYGIYDGCEELCDYIIKDIFNHSILDNEYQYNRNDFKNYQNIFFKSLIIDLDTSSDDGGECDDNIVINKDLLIDEVRINIYDDNPTKSSIKSVLMHELTHVYNNYIMQMKGNMGYMNTSQSDIYRNITDMSGGNTEKEIKQIMYFLLGYERNAFVAQLKAELEDQKAKIKTPHDALRILKNCPVYIRYKRVINTINYLIKKQQDDPESTFIADIYRDITNDSNNESSIKILKRLKSQSIKAVKKLDNIIPKLCVENLNNIKWRREPYKLV